MKRFCSQEVLIIETFNSFVLRSVDLTPAHDWAHFRVGNLVCIVAIRARLLATDCSLFDTIISASHPVDRNLGHDHAWTISGPSGRRIVGLARSLLPDSLLATLLMVQDLFLMLLEADEVEV